MKAKEVLGKPLEILLPEHELTLAMDLIKKTMEGETLGKCRNTYPPQEWWE